MHFTTVRAEESSVSKRSAAKNVPATLPNFRSGRVHSRDIIVCEDRNDRVENGVETPRIHCLNSSRVRAALEVRWKVRALIVSGVRMALRENLKGHRLYSP